MLAVGRVAQIVVERAVRLGHGGVVRLDAPLHLLEDPGLQRLGVGEDSRGIGVLGLQMGADVGPQRRRIVQHLAPVLVLHPGVVVGPLAAELFDMLRAFGGDRRTGNLSVHALDVSWTGGGFNRRLSALVPV